MLPQEQDLTITDVELLLEAMKVYGRHAVIDWVNRTIRVLSEPKQSSKAVSGDGHPLMYQDILHQFGGRR